MNGPKPWVPIAPINHRILCSFSTHLLSALLQLLLTVAITHCTLEKREGLAIAPFVHKALWYEETMIVMTMSGVCTKIRL
jgi:hypothetical protein